MRHADLEVPAYTSACIAGSGDTGDARSQGSGPVERVRLTKDEVVQDQPIDGHVGHEEIETNIPQPSRRRR
ncbi:hypothetical protein [Micromonospora inyonensis]|uniref:hypothetical protein n=1 Tax=Micromonospora inyonensis TaxID=47866 RepID=UPI000B89CBA5|nr:hypothetical protein [Micromonospora inyonensis]